MSISKMWGVISQLLSTEISCPIYCFMEAIFHIVISDLSSNISVSIETDTLYLSVVFDDVDNHTFFFWKTLFLAYKTSYYSHFLFLAVISHSSLKAAFPLILISIFFTPFSCFFSIVSLCTFFLESSIVILVWKIPDSVY